MDRTSGKLTVFFEDPFWVGIFERVFDGRLTVCKITFGQEPKDYEIWDFILRHYSDLKFSPAVQSRMKQTAGNPKRRQRNVGKLLQGSGIGTKSQQALQAQREEMKTQRRQLCKAQKDAEKQKLFDLKQQKRKEKHKGH